MSNFCICCNMPAFLTGELNEAGYCAECDEKTVERLLECYYCKLHGYYPPDMLGRAVCDDCHTKHYICGECGSENEYCECGFEDD